LAKLERTSWRNWGELVGEPEEEPVGETEGRGEPDGESEEEPVGETEEESVGGTEGNQIVACYSTKSQYVLQYTGTQQFYLYIPHTIQRLMILHSVKCFYPISVG
jgi:hypothetical protein